MATNSEGSLIADYRRRFETFREHDAQKELTTKELIDHLEKFQLGERQALLDLDSEKNERRRLQHQVQTLGEELKGLTNRRSFVLVLIDADADDYRFQERFLKNGLVGGRDAADEILARIKDYLKTLDVGFDGADIVVRAYANLKGLTKACVGKGLLTKDTDLSFFAHGFTERQALFDFVDVGAGKEGADNKIRKALSFYLGNSQCRHIILGCCHDSGYAPALGEFAAEQSSRDRITLLRGGTIHPRIQALGFTKAFQLESVFASPEGTIPSLSDKVTLGSPSRRFWNPSIDTDRLGPVQRNENGQRMDKILNVSSDSQGVIALRKAKLCYFYYLRGECFGCSRNHSAPPLNIAQYDGLWFLARQGVCFKTRKGLDCDDPKCIYSHSPKQA